MIKIQINTKAFLVSREMKKAFMYTIIKEYQQNKKNPFDFSYIKHYGNYKKGKI